MTKGEWHFEQSWTTLPGQVASFELISAWASWYRGAWLTITVALLGFRVTYARVRDYPIESLGREHAP